MVPLPPRATRIDTLLPSPGPFRCGVRGVECQIFAIGQRAAPQAVESHGAGIDPPQVRRRFGQFGRLGDRESRDAYRRSGNADGDDPGIDEFCQSAAPRAYPGADPAIYRVHQLPDDAYRAVAHRHTLPHSLSELTKLRRSAWS